MSLMIRSCAPGFSLFQLVDKIWAARGGNEPLHRMCTMMRWMCAQSVVSELVDQSFPEFERINQEIAAIEKRLSTKVQCEIIKLTFLRLRIDADHKLEVKAEKITNASNDEFLGYTIIINLTIGGRFKKSYIFESITRDLFPTKMAAENAVLPTSFPSHFLHVKKAFDCFVLGARKHYSILGAYFRQQNAITNVCAQACAAMVLNNCKGISKIVTCEDINRLIGMDHERRALIVEAEYANNDHAAESDMITTELREKVFPHYGFKADSYNQKDFRGFAYGFIESGYPALLAFSTPRSSAHLVAVVGHTLNSHSWFPSAYPNYSKTSKKHLSSLAWINDFVVHDDNFGMQLTFPAHCFNPEEEVSAGNGIAALEAIGIFPTQYNVRMLSISAEKSALKMLNQALRMFYSDGKPPPTKNYYVEHLADKVFANTPTVVLRSALVDRSAYLKHLKQIDHSGRGYSSDSIKVVADVLSKHERFWLVEATEPDLYAGNLSKVIDILIDPTSDPGTPAKPADLRQAWIALRFPEFLLMPKEFRSNDTEWHPPIPIGEVGGHLSLFLQ